MPLTPTDIRSRSFSRTLRGLDPEEVETFLETVAERVEQLVAVHAELKKRLAAMQETIDQVQDTRERVARRRERLDERKEQLAAKEYRLDEQRTAVEEDRETLMRVVARLQGEMESELQILRTLDSARAAGATGETSGDDAASTEELVDSLFPDRLAAETADAGENTNRVASDDELPHSDLDTVTQQFERIQDDLQKQESTEGTADPVEEDEEVSEEEVNRIMEVFHDID